MAICCKWGVCCKQLRQEEREHAVLHPDTLHPHPPPHPYPPHPLHPLHPPHPYPPHPHPLHPNAPFHPQGTVNQTYGGTLETPPPAYDSFVFSEKTKTPSRRKKTGLDITEIIEEIIEERIKKWETFLTIYGYLLNWGKR